MAKKNEPFVYGKSPAPRNWAEGAEALKSITKKHRKRSNSPTLLDKIDSLSELLKKREQNG
jgi:hypothetical protein